MSSAEHVALFALLCEGVALGAVVLGYAVLETWDMIRRRFL